MMEHNHIINKIFFLFKRRTFSTSFSCWPDKYPYPHRLFLKFVITYMGLKKRNCWHFPSINTFPTLLCALISSHSWQLTKGPCQVTSDCCLLLCHVVQAYHVMIQYVTKQLTFTYGTPFASHCTKWRVSVLGDTIMFTYSFSNVVLENTILRITLGLVSCISQQHT
jgi:hypothetical protein